MNLTCRLPLNSVDLHLNNGARITSFGLKIHDALFLLIFAVNAVQYNDKVALFNSIALISNQSTVASCALRHVVLDGKKKMLINYMRKHIRMG